MLVLAIDTCGPTGSVALGRLAGGGVESLPDAGREVEILGEIELDRQAAIKLLPLEVSVDRDFADRFRREARAMARLDHPNIITVHDFSVCGTVSPKY